MRIELPVCNKCCMCLPLRYGLIVWGYFRLILASFVLVCISFIIERYVQLLRSENPVKHEVAISEYVVLCLAAILVIADIMLGIIFIVGCYKKNTKLIRKYYHHNLFLLTLLIPLCLYIFGIYLIDMIRSMPLLDLTLYVITDFVGLFAYITIQIYIILLIRSEIIKLKKGSEYRFENKVAEAEIPLNVVISNGGNKEEIGYDDDNMSII
ncbi:unnamed protein product [Arctia plantaginis]|uniref:Uncharacterized protein n=1 Tax=Arctia plantaginis TaxID=874455 RepID=A0A8S0Z5K4_ARCPL|nr:unnamed protein product [Arctia plantaginis]CAB3228279.1 unnamed protein product [Arctia plantaginis]